MQSKHLSKILTSLGSHTLKENYKGISASCPMAVFNHKDGLDRNPSFFAFTSNTRNNEEPSWCMCHSCGYHGTISDLVTDVMLKSSKDPNPYLLNVFEAEWKEDFSSIPSYDEIPNFVKNIKTKHKSVKKTGECSFFILNDKTEIPLIINGTEYALTGLDMEKMVNNFSSEDLSYFIKRGVSDESIKKWDLKHTSAIRFKKFKKNKWFYTSFLNRAIFTIKNKSDKIIGWSARKVNNNDFMESCKIGDFDLYNIHGGPKYLHAQGFKKTDVLYGENFADETEKTAIISEGFFDCINIDKAGYKNSFAIMGGDLSVYQKTFLLDRFKKIIIFEDGDDAGVDIASSMVEKLKNDVEVVRVDSKKEGYFNLKDKKDPGDMDVLEIKKVLEKYFR